MKFSIIGAGKVGSAIGYKLNNNDKYELQAFCTRTRASLDVAARYLGDNGVTDVITAAADSELIIICVPDREIPGVAKELALNMKLDGRYVFHVSGSMDVSVLEAVSAKGAITGSIHPLQAFADIESAINNIDGAYFGINASPQGREVALNVVQGLGGLPIEIPDGGKVLYHAAACIASNYLVTLIETAQKAALAAGISTRDSLSPIVKLMNITLDNVGRFGTHGAITGPISRGATEIVKNHLDSFNGNTEISNVYKALGTETAKLSFEAGKIDKEQFDKIKTLLEGD